MDFDLSPRSAQWRKALQAFFDAEVLPRHRAWLEHVAANNQTPPFMADLQQSVWRTNCHRAASVPGRQRYCAAAQVGRLNESD